MQPLAVWRREVQIFPAAQSRGKEFRESKQAPITFSPTTGEVRVPPAPRESRAEFRVIRGKNAPPEGVYQARRFFEAHHERCE